MAQHRKCNVFERDKRAGLHSFDKSNLLTKGKEVKERRLGREQEPPQGEPTVVSHYPYNAIVFLWRT